MRRSAHQSNGSSRRQAETMPDESRELRQGRVGPALRSRARPRRAGQDRLQAAGAPGRGRPGAARRGEGYVWVE
jgi:hypothetical protein